MAIRIMFVFGALLAIATLCCLENQVKCQEEVEIEFDTEHQVAVIRQTAGSNTGAYAAVVYPQSIVGIYVPQTDTCYLIGGIPDTLPSLQQLMDNTKETKYQVNFRYIPAPDREVLDHALVPAALKSDCTDKTVQWLEPLHGRPSARGCFGIYAFGICVSFGK